MFKPQFTYTNSLINHLTLIERLYGQLISEKLIPSLSLKLSEENQILATHYSTSIEGNPLSQREVTNILLGDAIPTNKSELEVKNYFQALNHISVEAKKHKSLSIKLALDLHRLVMHRIDAKQPGLFRNQKVIVGHRGAIGLVVKHDPPFHKAPLIRASLEELFNYINQPSDLNPFIQAGILHHQVAYIHPFTDGNGRVTRLLTAYYLLLHGYEVTKYFILDDYYDIDRLEYSDKLHTADTGSKTEWLEYFLEGISFSLKAALERIKDVTERRIEAIKGDKRVLVSHREEDVLQIVLELKQVKTSDVVKHLQVSRQQAQSLLHNLVDKDILIKLGKTKASWYQLKRKTE
ncbi:MAG: Fic family protein [Candidatus Gottesmanbacteria bacterium GW2011_GWA1_34_13]|uniref:Fic family protein n=1 Tax=Candidatus Gottesmanbacteria bacterium GW2011_GWA1_34_13 TaxID=1618434 RepID=A0A0G0D3Y4_9BACT|nr:MAG: Fic family protein [Candidatus Gottesmanbacteria bacterium GW2011_GWA1_34_13]